jgi:hypothetical protein
MDSVTLVDGVLVASQFIMRETFDGAVPGGGGGDVEDFAFPESFTLTFGFLGSLEEILIVALFLPADGGAKVTVIVHELPFGIVVQLFV